ncbi:MAG: DNA/RNA nuclease SfsA [Thermodesulfovibrionales bacterium]
MFDPLRGITGLEEGIFLSRPNRFTVECLLNRRKKRAYLPNPGRLIELLLKGNRLYLLRNYNQDRKMDFTVLAVEREGLPILLHTHYANDVAAFLIENDLIRGLEGYRIKRREFSTGRSRFDFLLEKNGKRLLLEVKSCTLFGRDIAMFPDAITERGRRHLLEMSRDDFDACVLFIVNSPRVRYFLPDYHTDLSFARTLFNVREKILIRAIGIGWRKNLSLSGDIRELEIPWGLIEKDLNDSGGYILILYLGEDEWIEVGKLGVLFFKRGYYIYIGSAANNLSSRIDRHRRLRKRAFWHIDYLRERADYVTAFPLRVREDLECLIAQDIKLISDWIIPGFGFSDCNCGGHLFAMRENPLGRKDFIDILLYYRIDRLKPE